MSDFNEQGGSLQSTIEGLKAGAARLRRAADASGTELLLTAAGMSIIADAIEALARSCEFEAARKLLLAGLAAVDRPPALTDPRQLAGAKRVTAD